MTSWIVPRHAVRRVLPSPFGELWRDSLFDRAFDDVWSGVGSRPLARAAGFTPRVNVEESETDLRLTAELPGLEDKDFEVTVDGDLLTIKGEKRSEREVEDEGHSVIERSEGTFARSFRLAWEVDAKTISAAYKNGVLEVVIPKPDEKESRVRTIPVTSSAS